MEKLVTERDAPTRSSLITSTLRVLNRPVGPAASAGVECRPTLLHIGLWVGILIVTICLSVRDYRSYQVGVYGDDANYVILAQSLARANTFGLINFAGVAEPASFPPGFPLLLAPLTLIFPENLDVLKLVSLLATLFNLSLLFWGWRYLGRVGSYWMGLSVAALYALSPLSVGQTRMVMSEPVFTACCLIVLFLSAQAGQNGSRLWRCISIGAVLAAAVLVRTITVALVATVLIYLLIARRRQAGRDLLVIGASLAVTLGLVFALTPVRPGDLLPNQYRDPSFSFVAALLAGEQRPQPALTPSAGSATAEGQTVALKGLLTKYLYQGPIRLFGRDLRATVLPLGNGEREALVVQRLGMPFLPPVIALVLTGLIAGGCLSLFVRGGLSPFLLFLFAYFVTLLTWAWSSARLLYPVVPQLICACLAGLQASFAGVIAVARRRPPIQGVGRWLFGTVIVSWIALSALQSLRIEDSRLHVGDIRVAGLWLKANTPASAIVMTEKPYVDYLYGERKVVLYPTGCPSPAEMAEYIASARVDYVVVGPALDWQPVYRPVYSQSANCVLSAAQALAAQDRLELVSSAEQPALKIFKRTAGWPGE